MYVSIVSIKALPIVYGQSLLMLGPGLLFVLGRSHQSPTEPLRTLQTLFRWQASNLFSSTHSCLVLRAYDCRRWCIAKSVQKCECLARNKSLHRFDETCRQGHIKRNQNICAMFLMLIYQDVHREREHARAMCCVSRCRRVQG